MSSKMLPSFLVLPLVSSSSCLTSSFSTSAELLLLPQDVVEDVSFFFRSSTCFFKSAFSDSNFELLLEEDAPHVFFGVSFAAFSSSSILVFLLSRSFSSSLTFVLKLDNSGGDLSGTFDFASSSCFSSASIFSFLWLFILFDFAHLSSISVTLDSRSEIVVDLSSNSCFTVLMSFWNCLVLSSEVFLVSRCLVFSSCRSFFNVSIWSLNALTPSCVCARLSLFFCFTVSHSSLILSRSLVVCLNSYSSRPYLSSNLNFSSSTLRFSRSAEINSL